VVEHAAHVGISLRMVTSVCATAGRPKVLSARRLARRSMSGCGTLAQHGRIFPHIAAAGCPPCPVSTPSCEPDLVELRNAVEQTNKEIGTRFDFKGSDARVELLDKGQGALAAAVRRQRVPDRSRCATCCWPSWPSAAWTCASSTWAPSSQKLGGDKVKQPVAVKTGIDSETAKRIQGLVKQSKLKVQASIQGDAVRVAGAKRDDLQSAIALLKREVTELPLGFDNFRD
jgi:uncharacterized protein YajQ (UPF0234 family)